MYQIRVNPILDLVNISNNYDYNGLGLVFSFQTQDGTFITNSRSKNVEKVSLGDQFTFDAKDVCSATLWYKASNSGRREGKDGYFKLTGIELINVKGELLLG